MSKVLILSLSVLRQQRAVEIYEVSTDTFCVLLSFNYSIKMILLSTKYYSRRCRYVCNFCKDEIRGLFILCAPIYTYRWTGNINKIVSVLPSVEKSGNTFRAFFNIYYILDVFYCEAISLYEILQNFILCTFLITFYIYFQREEPYFVFYYILSLLILI